MKKIFFGFLLCFFLQNIYAQQSVINMNLHEMFKPFLQDKRIENIHHSHNTYRQYKSVVVFFEDLLDMPEIYVTDDYRHDACLAKLKPSSVVLYQRMENNKIKKFGYTLNIRKSSSSREIGLTNMVNRIYYLLLTKKAYLVKLKDGNIFLKKY